MSRAPWVTRDKKKVAPVTEDKSHNKSKGQIR